MNINIERKYIVALLAIFGLLLLALSYFYFKPWRIEGTWISGKNDGFGLMPTKTEFTAVFSKDKFHFRKQDIVVKKYEYDRQNKFVTVFSERGDFKIKIVDENTIRFNQGQKQ